MSSISIEEKCILIVMMLTGRMLMREEIIDLAISHGKFRHSHYMMIRWGVDSALNTLLMDSYVRSIETDGGIGMAYSLTFEGWVLANELHDGRKEAGAWVRPHPLL